jgi:hypothetical protein
MTPQMDRKGRPYPIIVPEMGRSSLRCVTTPRPEQRTLPPSMIGNSVAKAAAWCRAEQGDL